MRRKIKDTLKEMGINKHDAHFIAVEIMDDIDERISGVMTDHCEGTIESKPYVVSYEYREDDVEIMGIEHYDIEELLQESGLEYETSNRSESIYIQKNGKEIRVSMHNRPPVIDGFAAYEHQYDEEHICRDLEEMHRTVKDIIK